MHWIWNIKPNIILQNKGYYNYQINNVGISNVHQLPKCTSGSAMPPTILTTTTTAGGRSKNLRGPSTVLQGLLMEQVLPLIRSKFEGVAYPPYPTVPPALYVPLDSLQSRIFISSILTEVDKKHIFSLFSFSCPRYIYELFRISFSS